jgi:hypothetical protein
MVIRTQYKIVESEAVLLALFGHDGIYSAVAEDAEESALVSSELYFRIFESNYGWYLENYNSCTDRKKCEELLYQQAFLGILPNNISRKTNLDYRLQIHEAPLGFKFVTPHLPTMINRLREAVKAPPETYALRWHFPINITQGDINPPVPTTFPPSAKIRFLT